MEATENSLVEGAILWLAQTILGCLFISGKLDNWIRQFGPDEAIKELREEIGRVETVVAAVQGRATGNKPLAHSLARLRELMYDADDVVDELDYLRLQQVEGGATACANYEPEGTDLDGAELAAEDGTSDNSNIPSTSKKRKNRCEEWDHFVEKRDGKGKISGAECKYCRVTIKCGSNTGTNGLKKHLKNGKCLGKCPTEDRPPTLTSASDGPPNVINDATLDSVISKRRRTDGASTINITANTYNWNTSKRIHQITLELRVLRGTVTELLKDSVASSDQYQSNTSDTRLRTTSLVPPKVYGRDAEKDYIMRVLAAAQSDVVTVLPIVGIAGVGKTALAQLVYNDQKVKSQFVRIWVCVSYNFDEVTLTREMLDFLPQERNEGSPKVQYKHEGVSGLVKLQEILKEHMQCLSKRFLLILDDVWHNLDDDRWKRLLLPLQSSCEKGNVILVTTRNLSVARKIGTEEPIKLRALNSDDFWSLIKSCAFADDNYEGHPSLNMIGRQIAEKLKGNPLAAETAGKILRKDLNIEHYSIEHYGIERWSTILKNEDWKSLQLKGGIMAALKLSFDQLPYHLRQCFLYCTIFPNKYQFRAKDLVRTWVSLGFVTCTNSSKKLEETGKDYLTDLVNLGIFEKVEKITSGRTSYVICGIMHDFGRLVSKTEYATIDSLEFDEILPSVRHLSIVTDSAYLCDQQGTIFRNEKFETNLRSVIESSGKLRTLVLLGNYDTFFFTSFQDMLQRVQNLRLLHISAPNYSFYFFRGSLVNPVHLRHLKLELNRAFNHSPVQLGVYKLGNVTTRNEAYGASLRDKRKLEKLQLSWKDNLSVTDSNNSPSSGHFADTESDVLEGLEPHNNLKYLQISGYSGATSPAWLASSVTTLRVLHLDDCGEWQVLPSLENLTSLIKLKLTNMKKVIEVSIPSLQKLVLVQLPKLEICSCSSVKDLGSSLRVLRIINCHVLKSFPLFESCEKFNIEQKSWLCRLDKLTIHDCSQLKIWNNLPPSSNVYECVLEFPTMKGSPDKNSKLFAWSSSQKVVMLDDKSFTYYNLRMLTSLSICNQNRLYISFQGFKQLINLECLDIKWCKEILFSHVAQDPTDEYMAVANDSTLPSLRLLSVWSCGIVGKWLSVLLRHVKAVKEFSLGSCEQITALTIEEDESDLSDLRSGLEASSSRNSLSTLERSASDGLLCMPSNIMSSVKKMSIGDCKDLTYQGSKIGFARFTSLEELKIRACPNLIPSLVHSGENDDSANGRWFLPLSLGSIYFDESPETLQLCFPDNRSCLKSLTVQNSRSLKSLQLHSCTALEELEIKKCESLAALEGLQSLIRIRCFTLYSCPNLQSLELHLCMALEKLEIQNCESRAALEGLQSLGCLRCLTLDWCPNIQSLDLHSCRALEELEIHVSHAALEGLQSLGCLRCLTLYSCPDLQSLELHSCTALEDLKIKDCNSLAALEGLQSLGCLNCLTLGYCPNLQSLELHSCTALEELEIKECGSLAALEGLQSLGCLRCLTLYSCPNLRSLELHSCTALEELKIDECESLAALEGLQSLGCLRCLTLYSCPNLRSLELHSCTALEELKIDECESLAALEPVGLHSLPSLRKLKIYNCPCITNLSEESLPPSLEELKIRDCDDKLTEQCKMLATSKLRVKIDGEYHEYVE